MNETLLTIEMVKRIMNKRILVPEQAIGKRINFVVDSNGNDIDVLDKNGEPVESRQEAGTVLQKRIYNLQANSGLAMKNARNKAFLSAGLAAEKAGDAEEAHEQYRQYLNKVQMSVSVLLPNPLTEQLSRGSDISARVEMIKTDNGSLLNADGTTIVVVQATSYGKTTFNVDDALTDDEDEQEEETPATPAKPVKKEALKPAGKKTLPKSKA